MSHHTDKTKGPIHIVLVETLYSRNLGSCSRVMANLGADRLIAINPKCGFDLEARQGASGAQTRLVEMTTYPDWNEFFKNEPDGLRIAFSGVRKSDVSPQILHEKASEILAKQSSMGNCPIYLIFGREDHGLEDKDLEYAHHILRLPVYGDFESYNLSHAVLLALYHFVSSVHKPASSDPQAIQLTGEDRFFYPKEALQEWLTALGFEYGDRRRDVYTVLKRILLSNTATGKELRMLEAIVQQTVRKLKLNSKKD